MKKCFLLLPLLALAAPVAAQHTEIAARVGLGLLKFGGESAQRLSVVNYYAEDENGFTNNSYGRRLGAGVAVGTRVQRVGARNGLLALDLGYEWLQSRTKVTGLYYSPGRFSSYIGLYEADGHASYQNQSVTAFLGFGRRFTVSGVEIDALVGPEGAYVFDFREKGKGTYNGDKEWETSRRRLTEGRLDLRLRADATAWVHRVGFNASYSFGLLNYYGQLLGADPEAYSRTLRLGLAYRLR